MSDYHVLDGEPGARTYRLAFHIPVPSETNQAGVTLQAALAEDPVDKTSAVPGILNAEQNALNNGTLIELVLSYTRPPGNTLAQDRDAIDAMFQAKVTEVQDELRDKYRFWGFARDVP